MPKLVMILTSLIFASLACQTALPPEPTSTATLIPSATFTPTRTLIPTRNATATHAAQETAEMSHILEDIAPDLELAGYSIDQGQLAFDMEDTIDVTINQGGNWRYWQPLSRSNPVYGDFILGVDVRWESETGIAGCDILFRAESDVSDGEYVTFRTIRLSGYPGWNMAVIKFNQFQGFLTNKNSTSSAINLESGALNHYLLVANGTSVTVYANGTRLGTGTMPVHVTEGEIFFQAWQESKATSCIFSNAWVWDLSE